ncbi:MAG TPA: pilus assembly protein TadG-related protein [Vicinamibacterales bacterium]|nr:pilus assembly protein TadG-related protein [Vicinamibacterales bacterium]
MSFVFVGFGLLAFLSASILAIDVGMLMTARNQAQNSADAGALAGAVALFFDDYDDRTPSGPAVTSAITAAQSNDVMGEDVSVLPSDVEFLDDANGDPNQVRVTVYRHAMRGNPVSLLMARYLGLRETGGVAATATAEVSPANGMTCVKPFTIPDKWIENGNPPWDGDDTYDAFDNKGRPLPPSVADKYIPAADANGNVNPDYTGYNNERERGQRLVIRAGTGTNITVSFYFSLAIGGVTGGDEYSWNIENCNNLVMEWGDPLVQEPGNMVGPTIQGIEALIAKDPNAFWNEVTNTVDGSTYSGQSPRTFPIPLYDPEYYDSGKRNGRMADLKVANWIGFFAESVSGNSIYGRIIPIAGIRTGNPDGPTNLFPKAIRLVK